MAGGQPNSLQGGSTYAARTDHGGHSSRRVRVGALLTFNSILLAGFRISIDHGPYWVKVTNLLGSVGALVTCVVLLFVVMRVTWNAADSYETATTEFDNTLALLHKRSYVINILALVSMLGGLAAVVECVAALF